MLPSIARKDESIHLWDVVADQRITLATSTRRSHFGLPPETAPSCNHRPMTLSVFSAMFKDNWKRCFRERPFQLMREGAVNIVQLVHRNSLRGNAIT